MSLSNLTPPRLTFPPNTSNRSYSRVYHKANCRPRCTIGGSGRVPQLPGQPLAHAGQRLEAPAKPPAGFRLDRSKRHAARVRDAGRISPETPGPGTRARNAAGPAGEAATHLRRRPGARRGVAHKGP